MTFNVIVIVYKYMLLFLHKSLRIVGLIKPSVPPRCPLTNWGADFVHDASLAASPARRSPPGRRHDCHRIPPDHRHTIHSHTRTQQQQHYAAVHRPPYRGAVVPLQRVAAGVSGPDVMALRPEEDDCLPRPAQQSQECQHSRRTTHPSQGKYHT